MSTPADPGLGRAVVDAALVARVRALRQTDRVLARRLAVTVGLLALALGAWAAGTAWQDRRALAACRERQHEGEWTIQVTYMAEETHRAEHDRYSTVGREIYLDLPGTRYRYFARTWTDVATGAQHFETWAVGTVGEVTGDVWRMGDDHQLAHPRDACGR